MIIEFLFTSKDYRNELEHYSVPQESNKQIVDLQSSDGWIVCISRKGENETSAIILSNLRDEVCEKYQPVIITDGASAYFNKKLYPLANEFERKLRKLLYCASALHTDKQGAEVINNLEAMDLGTLFSMLFTDNDYVKQVRTYINKTLTANFTRKQIVEDLSGFEESVLWDRILGKDCVKTLRDGFVEVKNWRNDIMHAHNISVTTYQRAKQIFAQVNSELDNAIGSMLKESKDDNVKFVELFDSTKHVIQNMGEIVIPPINASELANACLVAGKFGNQLAEICKQQKLMSEVFSSGMWDLVCKVSNIQGAAGSFSLPKTSFSTENSEKKTIKSDIQKDKEQKDKNNG